MTRTPLPESNESAALTPHRLVDIRLAWALVVVFLLVILARPLWMAKQAAQGVRGIRQVFSAFGAEWVAAAKLEGDLKTRNDAARQAIAKFDGAIEERSGFSARLVPIWLPFLARLGVGAKNVHVGYDGWLEYSDAFNYVTGPPFLEPRTLAKRPDADPRPALLKFARDLAARGIPLWLVPTPAKVTVHPEAFAPAWPRDRPGPNNPSYPLLLRELEQAQIRIFDPVPVLAQARARGPAFLESDSHWSPLGVDRVAEALARALEAEIPLGPRSASWSRRTSSSVVSEDLARMLRLPEVRTVELTPVHAPNGRLWQASRESEVLLLGDSYANIYSENSSGLAALLAYHLGRDLDAIQINGGGSSATRLTLEKDLRQGQRRLAGTKVVILQFAARDLALGYSWYPSSLPPDRPLRAPSPADDVVLFGDGFESGDLSHWVTPNPSIIE